MRANEPEVLPVLLSEAERPHPVIQSYLANALGTFQDDRVIPVLSKLAGHPNREVAFQAACALGEFGGQTSIGVLKNVWRHGDALVRSACVASLRRLGSKPSVISRTALVAGGVVLAPGNPPVTIDNRSESEHQARGYKRTDTLRLDTKCSD